MHPQSLLWWIGGTAVLLAILGLLGMLAWWVDSTYRHRSEKRKLKNSDEGRSSLWLVFEVFSAILVVTSLLVAIYSNNTVLRAVAGVSLIVLVSAATVSLMRIGDKNE